MAELTIHGVKGRLTHQTAHSSRPPNLWFKQRWISTGRTVEGYRAGAKLQVEMRFDDEFGNGHNTFAITGTIYSSAGVFLAGGCLHEAIAQAFPELAPLSKWHLCSSDGPMHYLQNTIYLAGNRDAYGLREGEPKTYGNAVQFGDNPMRHSITAPFAAFLMEAAKGGVEGPFDLEVIQVPHGDQSRAGKHQFAPKYTFGGYGTEWHECPFRTEDEALRFLRALQRCTPRFVRVPTSFGEGKARELDAARSAAVWPGATDAELSAEPDELRAALVARLPALLEEFKAAIEEAGFLWEPAV